MKYFNNESETVNRLNLLHTNIEDYTVITNTKLHYLSVTNSLILTGCKNRNGMFRFQR